MYKDINYITITGGAFDSPTQIGGFLKNRLNLVYGKNGAGKSTLANAIASIAGKPSPGGLTASFDVPLTDDEKNKVFIFNESFVRNNLLVKEKGPANIVMIGSGDVALSNRIQELENEKESARGEMTREVDAIDAAKTEMGTCADELSSALRISGYYKRSLDLANLGGRNQGSIRINQNRLDAVIGADAQAKACSLPADVAVLSARFDEIMSMLKGGTGEMSRVDWQKPEITIGIPPEEINALLEKQVLKPELTEREKQIFAFMNEQECKDYWNRSKTQILEKNAAICPLCHQEISLDVRESLSDSVSRLLSEESNRFDRELQNAEFALQEINVKLPDFPVDMYAADLLKLNNAVEALNSMIRDAAQALQRRRMDMYSPESFRIDINAFDSGMEAVKAAIDVVVQDKEKYNESVENSAKLEKEAKAINNYIAFLENKDLCEKYTKAKATVDDGGRVLGAIDGRIRQLDREIRECGSQLNQTSTACKYINDQLANIFYAQDRLSLVAGDNEEYVLHSRGKAVSPGRVSTGERNIIALTYFFASLFQNETDAAKYSSARLIVIDDPVSSFDFGNRSGIVSFMRSEIKKILLGNKESKVLVLSHEMNTVTDLFHSLGSFTAPPSPSGKPSSVFYELLPDGMLKSYSSRDNEYWRMLQDVYKYANGLSQDDLSDNAIGNIMRRVLETYSTFTYQCGFKDMFDRKYVQSRIPGTVLQDYYRNFLGRFILDSQSHAGNTTDTLNFTASLFSREEKVQTARDLLKFLWYVNPGHLEAYLHGDQFLTICRWANEEKAERQ